MASITADELDRVVRGAGLLHLLPSTASQTREIVDATFRAFGVDRSRIVDAASKQLDALERFVRFSQEETQNVLDVNARRIAELEQEIERCNDTIQLATREGEERARTVNDEMQKVQQVIEFFGTESEVSGQIDVDLAKGKSDANAKAVGSGPPVPPQKPAH